MLFSRVPAGLVAVGFPHEAHGLSGSWPEMARDLKTSSGRGACCWRIMIMRIVCRP